MANLTRHLNVVGAEQSGIHPQPGCHIVVLKQIGEGRVLHRSLAPGVAPEGPKLLDRMFRGKDSFVAIPVSANRNLRHEFTSTVEHVSPGHGFEADYVLSFAAASPEKIATCWQEDPVRKVEQEIRRVLDPALRTGNWDSLRAAILSDGAAGLCADQVQKRVADLRTFAEEYGIEIIAIRMSLRLSRTDAHPEAEWADVNRRQQAILANAAKTRAEMTAGHGIDMLKAEHNAELRGLEATLNKSVRQIERDDEALDAGLAGLKTAIGNVAVHTTRVDEITHAIREIQMARSPVPGALLGEKPVAALGPGGESRLGELLQETVPLVQGLQGDAKKKRELLSVMLHLIAEAYVGGEPNDRVKEYERRADDLISAWGDVLRDGQFMALSQLVGFGRLVERLR